MPTVSSEGRKYWQSSKKYRRHSKPNMKFYNSTSWRKLRALKIATDPLCEVCLENGVLSDGKYVDHPQRINEGGDLLPDISELKTLCPSCDARKRQKESRKVGGVESCAQETSTTQPQAPKHVVNVSSKGG